MDFSELVKIRQSDRKYLNKAVEREKIELCIASARLSPSANNSQPWKFIIIDNPELKCKINNCAAGFGGMNRFANEAPVIIAVVLEKSNALSAVASVIQDKEYSLLDIGIAVNQLCLQAADIGLGTCIIGWFNENDVKKTLNIPRSKRVPLLITLGYPASSTRGKSRKEVEKICSWNKY